MMEEKSILSYIIRNFKFRSLDDKKDVIELPELILKPKHGLKMEFKLRSEE